MLGMPMLQSEMYAGSIKVIKSNGPREHFPHLMPPYYSNFVFAIWDEEAGSLSITFNAESDNACISIFKEDTLIIEDTCSTFEGYVVTYDFLPFGLGEYQIVISGIGDELLYGNF